MRRHILPFSVSFLPASRLWRKDRFEYINSSVTDHVLLTYFRNHTINVISVTIVGKIFAVHNAVGRLVGCNNNYNFERSLSEAEHA